MIDERHNCLPPTKEECKKDENCEYNFNGKCQHSCPHTEEDWEKDEIFIKTVVQAWQKLLKELECSYFPAVDKRTDKNFKIIQYWLTCCTVPSKGVLKIIKSLAQQQYQKGTLDPNSKMARKNYYEGMDIGYQKGRNDLWETYSKEGGYLLGKKEGREEIIKEIKQKIGMLRQWLNEDRITDVNKMVDNEDLEHWLTK